MLHIAANTLPASYLRSHRSLSQHLYDRVKEPVKANSVWVNTRVIKVKGWVESEEEREQGVDSLEGRTRRLESQ